MIKWKTNKYQKVRYFQKKLEKTIKTGFNSIPLLHTFLFPSLVQALQYKVARLKYRFSFSCPWVTIFNSRELRDIVTHIDNWRRICFSHYLTRTLFQNPSKLPIWQHAGKGTRHFNPLEDYRFFHHWFSGVKTP
jgi:hypothetical protein